MHRGLAAARIFPGMVCCCRLLNSAAWSPRLQIFWQDTPIITVVAIRIRSKCCVENQRDLSGMTCGAWHVTRAFRSAPFELAGGTLAGRSKS